MSQLIPWMKGGVDYLVNEWVFPRGLWLLLVLNHQAAALKWHNRPIYQEPSTQRYQHKERS